MKRNTVNARINQLCHVVRWGVKMELLPESVLSALLTVDALRPGETDAPESIERDGVAAEHVRACLPFMGPMLRDMVLLQMFSAMRGKEVFTLRSCEVDTTGKAWTYTLAKHKTQHHGKKRVVKLGPQAKAALGRWLLSDLQAYVFAPARAESARLAERKAGDNPPPTQVDGPRQDQVRWGRKPLAERYNKDTYNRAIRRAIDRAFPPPAELRRLKGETPKMWRTRLGPENWEKLKADRKQYTWTPHQLRHAQGQLARDVLSVEHAQAMMGHANVKMTEKYAKDVSARAEEAALKIG
ncbi:MAG: site-specific integrase [Tepidisphaeraceae bacterium]